MQRVRMHLRPSIAINPTFTNPDSRQSPGTSLNKPAKAACGAHETARSSRDREPAGRRSPGRRHPQHTGTRSPRGPLTTRVGVEQQRHRHPRLKRRAAPPILQECCLDPNAAVRCPPLGERL
jgi:hypothetical protein